MSLKLLKQGIGSITLLSSWDRTNNARQYELRYRLTNDLTWLTHLTPDTFVVLTGLSIDKAYECEVRSLCNRNRVSQYSKAVWFNTASVWNQTATGDLYLANPNAQIGIGSVPSAKLHVLGSGLFEGTNGGTPISGAGTRMMWVPNKSAFRTGTVNGTQWDDANIGIGSIAMGENSLASGTNSFALGKNNTVTGSNSFAIGQQTQATASNAFAYGYGVQAAVPNSMALGFGKLDDLGNLVSPGVNLETGSLALFNGDINPIFISKTSIPQDWGIEPQGGTGGGEDPCKGVKDNIFTGNIRLKYTSGTVGFCGGNLCVDGRISGGSLHTATGLYFSPGCSTLSTTDYRIVRTGNYPNANLSFTKGGGREYLRFTSNNSEDRIGIMENNPDESIHLGATTKIQRTVNGGSSYNLIINTKGTDANNVNSTKALSIYRQIGSQVDQDRIVLFSDGNAIFKGKVGIGIDNPPSYATLAVNGVICSKESRVSLVNPCWPDFVFEPTYELIPLNKLEAYIKANQHLPGIPSAQEVEREGIELGKMNALLLQKIEEMTLHMITLQKQIDELKAKTAK